MSEDTKKVGKTEPEATELSEQELNKVAGGSQKIVVENIPPSTSTTDEDRASPNLF
jgi:hypothetical protein